VVSHQNQLERNRPRNPRFRKVRKVIQIQIQCRVVWELALGVGSVPHSVFCTCNNVEFNQAQTPAGNKWHYTFPSATTFDKHSVRETERSWGLSLN
jgi:hypothetical protein